MLPSVLMSAICKRRSSVMARPDGEPSSLAPMNTMPARRWSGRSLAKAQTASRTLSDTVLNDSFRSTSSDSRSASSSSNSGIPGVVIAVTNSARRGPIARRSRSSRSRLRNQALAGTACEESVPDGCHRRKLDDREDEGIGLVERVEDLVAAQGWESSATHCSCSTSHFHRASILHRSRRDRAEVRAYVEISGPKRRSAPMNIGCLEVPSRT